MSKRQPAKASPGRNQDDAAAMLRAALTRRRKAELVDTLVTLAQSERKLFRRLTSRVDLVLAPGALVRATHQAIRDATAFDKRDINRNFAYDYEAYEEVKRNLGHLAAAADWRSALQLALELMKQGRYQAAMSDEGLMSEDIEACLSVVLQALPNCNLPAAEVLAWCQTMLAADQTGFLAQAPLQALQTRLLPPTH